MNLFCSQQQISQGDALMRNVIEKIENKIHFNK